MGGKVGVIWRSLWKRSEFRVLLKIGGGTHTPF